MKKIVVGVAVALATLIMCMCFAACSSSVAGTYKFQSMSMTMGGVEVNYEAGKEVNGVTITEDAYTLEIKSDNTWTMSVDMLGEKATQEGTWEEKDGKYVLSVKDEEETISLTKEGSTLVMEQSEGSNSMKIVLKKK